MTPPAPTARALSLWLPVIAWAAVIFVLSSQPSLPPLPPDLTDKLLHAAAYAVLAATCIRALAGGRWEGVTVRTAGLGALAAALYGITDEIHQWFVPGRMVEATDVLADFTGSLASAAAAVALGWLRARRAARI